MQLDSKMPIIMDMITAIPGLPENVLGFSAHGIVSGADYEDVLIPAIEEKLSRFKKVRFLYHLGEDFSGYDAAAMWDDAKIGLKHPLSWERAAVVTDVEWIRVAIRVFGFVIPGEFRIFHNNELSAARDWVCE